MGNYDKYWNYFKINIQRSYKNPDLLIFIFQMI